MMHPAFARKRLETAILSAGVADDAEDASDFTCPEGLPALAILLGNRARNGKPNGDVPAALRDMLAAEGVTLPGRAEGALRFAEAHALGVAPLPPAKKYHMASKIRPDGAVSALCFDEPRAIDLRRASWTWVAENVTCAACKVAMAGGSAR